VEDRNPEEALVAAPTVPLPQLSERVEAIMPAAEWAAHAPLIAEINELKAQRDAVILAHNYQRPEIFHGVADITGDSLALARRATEVDADVIVQCGVHFMAETSKLLNPDKTVLLPDLRAGCSLAESITGADVRLLRERYPGVPVVTYVNTSAEVKAESDVCCTSSNAVDVVESLGTDRVIFLPDEFLGQHVANHTDVEVIVWRGHCEVHERFTGGQVRDYRAGHENLTVLAHPECPQDVLAEADYVGSTSGMARYVGERQPAKVAMITECSMSDNVAAEHPEIEFVRPCNLCPHMKRITLQGVHDALRDLAPAVEIDPSVAVPARAAVDAMLAVGRR
jgi:quinolinate synthase